MLPRQPGSFVQLHVGLRLRIFSLETSYMAELRPSTARSGAVHDLTRSLLTSSAVFVVPTRLQLSPSLSLSQQVPVDCDFTKRQPVRVLPPSPVVVAPLQLRPQADGTTFRRDHPDVRPLPQQPRHDERLESPERTKHADLEMSIGPNHSSTSSMGEQQRTKGPKVGVRSR